MQKAKEVYRLEHEKGGKETGSNGGVYSAKFFYELPLGTRSIVRQIESLWTKISNALFAIAHNRKLHTTEISYICITFKYP